MTNNGASPSGTSRLLKPVHSRFNDNVRRARYGVAYVEALCAHAGTDFRESSPDTDVSAVDGSIEFARMPVRVQIKCTSRYQVGARSLTLRLKSEWVDKWTESDTPVFVIVVKVPQSVPEWVEHADVFTRHHTVAFGKRFEPGMHTSSMKFTAADKMTSETLYEWRDLAYAIADGAVA